MNQQPEEINVCQDCHERRGRPPVIDYPTNPFILCHDCNADTDLLAIKNPHQGEHTMTEQPATITQDNLAEFLIGYRDAAHWTGQAWDMSDENGYDHAEPIDDGHDNTRTPDDIPAFAAADIMAEALNTFSTLAHHNNGHTLATYAAERHQQSAEYSGWELTGHDAYLTLAGHGTGLWDRGIEEGTTLSDTLTRCAQTLTLDTATDTYYYE